MSAFDDDVADFDLDQPAPFTASKPVPVPAELVDELRDVLAEPTPYGGNVIRVARALVDAVERPSKCPDCGHMPHGSLGFCPNMASDNECSCQWGYPYHPAPSISDEAEAREELRQLAAAYLAAWGGGIPKLWHDAFTALGIEPMGDIQAAFDLAQSLAARLDRATKENNHE